MDFTVALVMAFFPACLLAQFGPGEPVCTDDTCHKDAICVNHGSFITCDCQNGKVGVNCDLEDPCTEVKDNCPAGSRCFGICHPNVVCHVANDKPQCSGCMVGWTGEICNEDVDECKEMRDAGENRCGEHGTCENIKGSYKCACEDGWVGKTCNCTAGSECDPDPHGLHGAADSLHVTGALITLLSLIMYNAVKYL